MHAVVTVTLAHWVHVLHVILWLVVLWWHMTHVLWVRRHVGCLMVIIVPLLMMIIGPLDLFVSRMVIVTHLRVGLEGLHLVISGLLITPGFLHGQMSALHVVTVGVFRGD